MTPGRGLWALDTHRPDLGRDRLVRCAPKRRSPLPIVGMGGVRTHGVPFLPGHTPSSSSTFFLPDSIIPTFGASTVIVSNTVSGHTSSL